MLTHVCLYFVLSLHNLRIRAVFGGNTAPKQRHDVIYITLLTLTNMTLAVKI